MNEKARRFFCSLVLIDKKQTLKEMRYLLMGKSFGTQSRKEQAALIPSCKSSNSSISWLLSLAPINPCQKTQVKQMPASRIVEIKSFIFAFHDLPPDYWVGQFSA